MNLDPYNWEIILTWDDKVNKYKNPVYSFKVRDKEIKIQTHTESLSHSQIPKVAVPKYQAWGDILRWCLQENVPGEFPYAAGLYPFKREGEDPTRMFAGEGGPERTNKRFHYVSKDCLQNVYLLHLIVLHFMVMTLITVRIFMEKLEMQELSICCLDDAKKLYSGFNLLTR